MNNTRPLLPPTRSQLSSDWRRNFITDATVKVLANIRKSSDDEIRREIRGAVTPMRAADFPGGSVAKLITLAPKSAASQLFGLATKIDLAGITNATFPLPTNFAAGTFIGEGVPIPVRQGSFSGFTVGPVRKLALLAALSNELEIASGDIAQAVISNTLEVAVGRGLDAVLFSADAADADSPAGILNGVTPITGTASMSADLGALVGKIAEAGIDTASVVFIASPPQAMAITLQAGPHFAHKVIEASGLAAGTVVAVAAGALIVAGDGTPTVDTSQQALLHHADPASHISTAGAPNVVSAPVVSTYQANLIALRCIARITWTAAPGAVAELTGAQW